MSFCRSQLSIVRGATGMPNSHPQTDQRVVSLTSLFMHGAESCDGATLLTYALWGYTQSPITPLSYG